MHKMIDVKLTSVFSPICQTLIHENVQRQAVLLKDGYFNTCAELLIIRLDGVVIAYATFEVIDYINVDIHSLYFRDIIKDHSFAEYWLSRQLKRHLRKNSYLKFLLRK